MSDRPTLWAISHCDDGSCDLGRIQYTCPTCHKCCDDYGDLWWQRDNYWHEDGFVSWRCENCNAELLALYEDCDMVVYDAKEWLAEYAVRDVRPELLAVLPPESESGQGSSGAGATTQ